MIRLFPRFLKNVKAIHKFPGLSKSQVSKSISHFSSSGAAEQIFTFSRLEAIKRAIKTQGCIQDGLGDMMSANNVGKSSFYSDFRGYIRICPALHGNEVSVAIFVLPSRNSNNSGLQRNLLCQ